MRRFRIPFLSAIVGLVTLAVLITNQTGVVSAQSAPSRTTAAYQITITNLTSGQAFSPPVLATHRRSTSLFHVGRRASKGIQEIAENGNNAALLAALAENRRVFKVVEGPAPLVPAANPGNTPFTNSATYTIEADSRHRFLSFATMLICTNDGFTGVDSVRLPPWVGESITLYSQGYDAGTEINTERFADIVPPCQGLIGVTGEPGTGVSNPALAENGRIRHHPGIKGVAGLQPQIHGWADPVAKIEIKRIK
jgi:hypothetical protein